MSVIFNLKRDSGGFFSQFWQLVERYLYAKTQNTKFYINDDNWLFKHTLGWYDYFSTLETTINNSLENEYKFQNFSLNEYRNVCKEIFVFNSVLNDRLNHTMEKFGLIEGEYDTIMIRRGDKMFEESDYIKTDEYVLKLLEKEPKIIFVQTDDYNAYKEVCDIVNLIGLKCKVITTCPDTKYGSFTFNWYRPQVSDKKPIENYLYLANILSESKRSVNEYNSHEMKEHVEEMLVGLTICSKGRYLVTDFQSNVSRYLPIVHSDISKVIPVRDNMPDFNIPTKCPCNGF